MFIHLHTHSNYSFLTGAIRIEELIAQAKKFKMPAIALTDLNGMYGLIDFAKLAEEERIKPILGATIDDPNNCNFKVVLLAKNRQGYSELCKIITERQLSENFSLIETLKNYLISEAQNLIFLNSSLEFLVQLKNEIGNINSPDFYVELFSVSQKKSELSKIRINAKKLYEFAVENNLPFVATNPVYFLKKEDFLLHKVLFAIKYNTTLSHIEYLINKNFSSDEINQILDKKLREQNDKYLILNDVSKKILSSLATEENYFKSSEEMMKLWKSLPEAIENTKRIADACNVDLEFGKYKHPKFPLPKGETSFSYLWKIAFRGLEEKYKPITQQAVNRLQEELNVIEQLGFADYFLIVWDIAQQAKRMNMM
ncbi:MAG: PHP domain-containing protein, partial [Ignavibacteria bacterium]